MYTHRTLASALWFSRSGKAAPENSGFEGAEGWGPDPDTLNNNFYETLLENNGRVTLDSVQEFQNNSASNVTEDFPDQFLWRINNGPFMLNVDMALAFDMDGHMDPVTGAVNCSIFVNGTIPPSMEGDVATAGPV
jgi:catalase (peroxidase I)